MRTNHQAIEVRARDAVARLLSRMLRVPDIYFEAHWPNQVSEVDVLAIDRAGTGDVHAVEIKGSIVDALKAADNVMRVPAQFRWLAFFGKADPTETARKAKRGNLFASEGMGRIGVIRVFEGADEFGDLLRAEVIVRAERFAGSFFEQTQQFGKTHQPDIFVR